MAQAAQRLASGQRDDGRRFYRVFIQRSARTRARRRPTWRFGMSFVQESKYPNAAAEFQKVLTATRRRPRCPRRCGNCRWRSCS